MKKVLIVSYYWPPAGGPGVQRWLKFVKYLPEFGIEPIVYIPQNPSYPIIDEALVNEIPKGVTIISRKIIEPYGFGRLLFKGKVKKISSGIIPASRKQSFAERMMIWIRGNFFIPDARILWVRPSVTYLEKYIAENNIDTIITSGPPHSLHLIGLELRKQFDVRWIADFRDPWTTIGYHNKLKLSEYAKQKHQKLERKVLNNADIILVTSRTTKVDFAAMTKRPINVITNGYDVETLEKPKLDSKFTLAHIGSFLSDRNPLILWEALVEIIEQVPTFKNDFELKLIGTVSVDVLDTIARYNLSDYINNIGYVSHSEAIAHQRKSQVLLLIEIDAVETRSIIPGKIFEYMVSGRPIIGIGPSGSDFAEIIDETSTGIFVNYSEKEKLRSQILQYYQQYIDGVLTANGKNLEKYSRRHLSGELAEIINMDLSTYLKSKPKPVSGLKDTAAKPNS